MNLKPLIFEPFPFPGQPKSRLQIDQIQRWNKTLLILYDIRFRLRKKNITKAYNDAVALQIRRTNWICEEVRVEAGHGDATKSKNSADSHGFLNHLSSTAQAHSKLATDRMTSLPRIIFLTSALKKKRWKCNFLFWKYDRPTDWHEKLTNQWTVGQKGYTSNNYIP